MRSTDRITVSTEVDVDPATAFEVFTDEIGTWWGDRMRPGSGPYRDREGTVRFEPGPGGRLLEVFDDPAREPFEIGRVRVWERASRLVVEWRQGNFEPDQVTEVEIRFERAAGGTRVTVEHRGWDSLPTRRMTWRGCARISTPSD